MNEISFSKLSEYAIVPTRKHPYDAGLDLYACLKWKGEAEDVHYPHVAVHPHGFSIIPTCIAVRIPEGYAGFIWPKSRNEHLIGGGVVDCGYVGQIFVKVINTSDRIMEILHGDAIGQLIIQRVETPVPVEVHYEELTSIATERGTTGGIASQYKTETFTSHVIKVE